MPRETAIELSEKILSRFPYRLTNSNWDAFKTPLEDALRCAKVYRMLCGRVARPSIMDEEAIEEYESKRSEAKLFLNSCIGEEAFRSIMNEPVEEMWDALNEHFNILAGGGSKLVRFRTRKLRELIDLNPGDFAESGDLDQFVAKVDQIVSEINQAYKKEATGLLETSLIPFEDPLRHGQGSSTKMKQVENGESIDATPQHVAEVEDFIHEDLHREILHAKLLTNYDPREQKGQLCPRCERIKSKRESRVVVHGANGSD